MRKFLLTLTAVVALTVASKAMVAIAEELAVAPETITEETVGNEISNELNEVTNEITNEISNEVAGNEEAPVVEGMTQ